MFRITRYLLPGLVTIDIGWRILSPAESTLRDLYLYNSISLIALLILLGAPLQFDRVALGSIALAISLWGIGSLAASVDELIFESARFTLTTQILYALFYPLMAIAIPRIRATQSRLKPIELLDSLIFSLGFTAIVATLLFVAIFPDATLLASDNYFAIFYPVGDIALLLISIITLITKGFHSQLVIFTVGILIFAANDVYYLWLAINNRYSFGALADTGWLIAITIIAFSTHLSRDEKSSIAPIPTALVATSIFVSPIFLAISALRPHIFPIYILIPAIANLLLGFIRLSTTLREAKALNDERTLARTDELTGLANRRKLLAEIDNFSEAEGALLLLDLDKFKPVNDQFGHEVGDLILRQVAQRFSRTVPEGAILARLGGDEFGILIRGSYEETLEIAHALRASLSYPFSVEGQRISVGVSVGIAHNDGAGDLMRRADSAMYRAKQLDVGVAQP